MRSPLRLPNPRGLSRRSEHIRHQLFLWNAGKGRNLRHVFDWDRLPLRYGAWAHPTDLCQVPKAATLGFEICCELFHEANLSPTEVSVKLILSV